MPRTPCCEKIGLKRGKWSREEDEILTKYMSTHGPDSWRSLPKKAGLLRCGKSCRLRWINYLKKDLKRGNITDEEDHIIVKMHSLVGNRWSLIASHLPGRTDNEIKNYWRSHLSRKIIAFKHNHIPDDLILKKCSSSSTSEAKNKQMVTTSQCFPQPKELESHEVIEGKCFEPYEWLDTEINGLISISSEEAMIGVNDDQNKTCESEEVEKTHDMNMEKQREESVLKLNSNEKNDEDCWIGLCKSLEVGFGIDEEEIHKWEFQSCATTHLSRKIYAFSSVSADDFVLKKSYSSSPEAKTKQIVITSKCFKQLRELESEIINERRQSENVEGECFEPYQWLDTEINGLMTGEEAMIGVNDDQSDHNKTCESVEVQELGYIGKVDHDINMEKQREESVLELNSSENGDEDRWIGQCNSQEVGFGIDEEEMQEWEFQSSVTHPSDEIWNISDL